MLPSLAGFYFRADIRLDKLQEFYAMGGCMSVSNNYSAHLDGQGHSGTQPREPVIKLRCQRKIDYIRKHFPDHTNKEQKTQLGTLERVTEELGESCKNLNISEEVYVVLFQSIHDEIKVLKRKIENKSKATLSDCDAFNQRIQRGDIVKLDIFDIVSIPKHPLTPPSMDELLNINFPILSYSNNNLTHLTGLILKNSPFVVQQGIKSSKIDALLETLCLNYNITAYHNFSHAFSVFLMANQTYHMSPEVRSHLSHFELFFMLLAGISHDLNHKGKNNAYHIKKRSRLAITYCDQSVLQNMHTSTIFRLMSEKPECDILSNIKDTAMKARARKIIVKCIMATDMTTHFSGLKEFKQKCAEPSPPSSPSSRPNSISSEETCHEQNSQHLLFNKDKEADRDLIMETIIHACDIGNPCLQFSNYMNWAALLAHEFDHQNKRQVFLGLDLTPMLHYTNKENFYKGQIGFSKNLVLPLWKQLAVFSDALKIFPGQVEKNIQTLEQLR